MQTSSTDFSQHPQTDIDLEAELRQFEEEERQRLGLPSSDADSAHWRDPVYRTFTADQRAHTTILVCGLTAAHDLFVKSAFQGLGYKVEALDAPDNEALQFGKEYGNRGQCNPTYFTVGNLVKFLCSLRDQHGLSPEEICDKYLFLTAGACGPCRFGTYVTEYRKALRDAGFERFRVLLFQQTGGLKQATGEEVGLKMDPGFFWGIIKALMIGDVLNAMGYRMRPYEVEAGATDRALEACRQRVCETLAAGKNILPALYACRRELAQVKVDRTRVKPKVAIIGEFWAMTTEGDGNYRLQRFLEQEGAEVDIQLVTAWLLYMIWQGRYDTERRAELRGTDSTKFGLKDVNVRKRLAMLAAGEKVCRGLFQSFAHAIGLQGYHLPDMNELAKVSHEFYDNSLRGGEGHMEVGKLIMNIAKSKVNMTLSVKPFGCMPSSSVSDGVQSLITEMYPEGIFLPIETSGDGAVNVYSRIQMQLFKAKQLAQKEVDRTLAASGLSMDQVRALLLRKPHLAHAFHKSPHTAGCTAADLVAEVAAATHPLKRVHHQLKGLLGRRTHQSLSDIAHQAAAKAA